MKIAVCISGGIKYPHLSLESIKKIIPNEYIKIFIHTWKVKDKTSYLNTVCGVEHKEKEKTIETDISYLQNFNFEKLLIENYDEYSKKFTQIYNNAKFLYDEDPWKRTDIGPISMFYSIYKANELKKEYEKNNNIIFDWVIRMRFDSEFRKQCLDVRNLTGILNIPEGEDWNDPDIGINDQFAVGKSHIIDLYSSVYKNLLFVQKTNYVPERILLTHLKNMNINDITRFYFPVRINNGIDHKVVYHPNLML